MKTFTIILVLLLLTSKAFALNEQYQSTIDLDENTIEKYETVQIYCGEHFCMLLCLQPGTYKFCDWSEATWCEGCNFGFFQDANGDEMFEYAKDRINEGYFSGVYYSNLYLEESQRTIYRTVTWSSDLILQKANIDITLSE